MKNMIILPTTLMLLSQVALASQDITCRAKESGMDLSYITKIEGLTESKADRLAFYFENQNLEHLFCQSVAPLQVSVRKSEYKLTGQIECEDSNEYRTVELTFDSEKMTLDTGVRKESCTRAY